MSLRKESLGLPANASGADSFHPPILRKTFTDEMNRRALHLLKVESDGDDEAILRIEQYSVAHPGSPSAVRRPKIFREGDIFIVLLGRDVQHGIVGLGNTVENAMRAFDLQYCNALRPPEARSRAATARAHGRK